MANIFLDANIFIDLVEKRKEVKRVQFVSHKLYISPLSIYILNYLYKYHIPEEKFFGLRNNFTIVPFNQIVVEKSMHGPTSDFEDNVQLHSAVQAECDVFLTNYKKLLGMRFFGRTKIAESVVAEW